MERANLGICIPCRNNIENFASGSFHQADASLKSVQIDTYVAMNIFLIFEIIILGF